MNFVLSGLNRIKYGVTALWCRKVDDSLRDPQPSTAILGTIERALELALKHSGGQPTDYKVVMTAEDRALLQTEYGVYIAIDPSPRLVYGIPIVVDQDALPGQPMVIPQRG